MRPKIIVFASGTRNSGGSGFENLVEATKTGVLDAEVVAVISNHEHGGVRERAKWLGVPFVYFNGPYTAENYQRIVANAFGAEPAPLGGEASLMGWVALSGWLKQVKGLDPRNTFNIHPALLSQLGGPFDGLRASRFGGKGMYGHHIHEAVKAALDTGEITESGFTMHFVTDEYDRGPVFFEHPVPLKRGMTTEEIAKTVNAAEHEWQPKLTNMVVHGKIQWDGKDPRTLVVPSDLK